MERRLQDSMEDHKRFTNTLCSLLMVWLLVAGTCWNCQGPDLIVPAGCAPWTGKGSENWGKNGSLSAVWGDFKLWHGIFWRGFGCIFASSWMSWIIMFVYTALVVVVRCSMFCGVWLVLLCDMLAFLGAFIFTSIWGTTNVLLCYRCCKSVLSSCDQFRSQPRWNWNHVVSYQQALVPHEVAFFF